MSTTRKLYIFNAILYVTRSGCQWKILPHDFPPKSTAYKYFARWRDNGKWDALLMLLRGTKRQAEAPGVSYRGGHSRTFAGGKLYGGIRKRCDGGAGFLLAAQVNGAPEARESVGSKYHNHDLNAWLDRQRSIRCDLEIVRRPSGMTVLPNAMDCRTYLQLARTLAHTQSQL